MATIKITSGVGLRRGIFFKRDDDGYPISPNTGTVGFPGYFFEGMKGLTMNVPGVNRIQHVGDDNTFAQDFLPPSELPSGNFTTGKANMEIDAVINDITTQQVGDGTMILDFTDKQGNEQDGIFVYYRQALNTEENGASAGSRTWQSFIMPSLRIIYQGNSPDQGSDDTNAYEFVPTKVSQAPWGVAFTDDDNGAEEALRMRFNYENPAVMEVWNADGTIGPSGNDLLTTWTPISTTKTKVWANGTVQTVSAVDVDNKTITLDSAPVDGDTIVAWYETSDSLSQGNS